jgi:isocitrate/isopropylmalate dehydrogenase
VSVSKASEIDVPRSPGPDHVTPGILYTPIERSGHTSWNVAMRQQLDIYASISLCKSVPGMPTRHKDVDFVIIRENTEGEYSGLEHQSYPGVVESLKIMTRYKSERIARFAFDFALKNNRKVRLSFSLKKIVIDIPFDSDSASLASTRQTS